MYMVKIPRTMGVVSDWELFAISTSNVIDKRTMIARKSKKSKAQQVPTRV
jgi:hypothetical protein